MLTLLEFLALADERESWWRIPASEPERREQWRAVYRRSRAYLVQRAPECDDYPRLMTRVRKAVGDPKWSVYADPPTLDEQQALIDEGLRRLWAEALD